jgi:hypothetical protein
MKICLLSLVLLAICLTACGKSPTATAHGEKSTQHPAGRQEAGRGVLTQEEVSAILGQPVTSAEGSATDTAYKTATLGLETTVGVENENDAEASMAGARKATGMLGGWLVNLNRCGPFSQPASLICDLTQVRHCWCSPRAT